MSPRLSPRRGAASTAVERRHRLPASGRQAGHGRGPSARRALRYRCRDVHAAPRHRSARLLTGTRFSCARSCRHVARGRRDHGLGLSCARRRAAGIRHRAVIRSARSCEPRTRKRAILVAHRRTGRRRSSGSRTGEWMPARWRFPTRPRAERRLDWCATSWRAGIVRSGS